MRSVDAQVASEEANLPEFFRINPRQIVYETFDNEVLAINLDTGTYYSLPGSSGCLWSLVMQGASVETIIRVLAEVHDHEAALIGGAVLQFVEQLREEHLILPDMTKSASDPLELKIPTGAQVPFVSFELKKFTDMQDLLLLDPIHDVEEAGWPLAKPDTLDPAGS